MCPSVTMEQCAIFFFFSFSKFGQYCLTPHQIRSLPTVFRNMPQC